LAPHARLSHSSLLYHPNNIWFGVQFTQLLVIHSRQRVRKGRRVVVVFCDCISGCSWIHTQAICHKT